MSIRRYNLCLTVSVVLTAVTAVAADDFNLTWYTIDGGGEMSSAGGGFELAGTIGQPDAGMLTGDVFELKGGFWVTVEEGCAGPEVYGDVFPTANPDGGVDFDDVLCVLNGFANPDDCPNADIFGTVAAPCVPDGQINFDDVLAVLEAFAGNPACSCE